jgi:protein-tyrosine phosphatase
MMQHESAATERQGYKTLKGLLRRAVPDSLANERQTLIRLGPAAAAVYARLRLLDLLGMHARKGDSIPPAASTFLFVCFGNLMRSPMAEAMFHAAVTGAGLTNIFSASAGLHAIPGTSAHPWAMVASSEIGVCLEDHRAQLLTFDLISRSDVVFAMDLQNKAELLTLYPESRSKIFMLGVYAHSASQEIPDPYLGSLDTTRCCSRTLQSCIGELTADLVAVRRRQEKVGRTL